MIELPKDITQPQGAAPRDLAIISIPKCGKGTILGKLTEEKNAIVLDLEKGGYDYIPARKLSTYTDQSTTKFESYSNYITYRNLLLENKGVYDYLIIDGLSDLDDIADIGGTFLYMNSIIGKKWNRKGDIPGGDPYSPTDPEWRSVLSLAEGAGYKYHRDWFFQQFELFRQISPYRIYAAHVVDKYIKDNGKEEVVGSEISLTGKLKFMFASKVTSLAKLVAEGNKRYLNFDVINDSVISGSRAPHLNGKILISEMKIDSDSKNYVKTYWENIYK